MHRWLGGGNAGQPLQCAALLDDLQGEVSRRSEDKRELAHLRVGIPASAQLHEEKESKLVEREGYS